MSSVSRVRKKPLIGLAGGIGSGKSTVAGILASLGCGVIDSDFLAHQTLGDAHVTSELKRWWGEAVVGSGGEIDRGAVGAIVFAQPDQRVRLERLLYPKIAIARVLLLDSMGCDETIKAIVFDTPKLFEVGLNSQCDVVLFVDADIALRRRRVVSSRGWSERDLDRREKLLEPLDMKRAKADHVIVNHFDVEALRFEIVRFFSSVLASYV